MTFKSSLITIALSVGFSLASVYATKAHADVVASTKTNTGATIFITDDKASCPSGNMQMFLVTTQGKTEYGCWRPMSIGDEYAAAMVRYEDGSEYTYRGKIWTFTPYGERWAKPATTKGTAL